MTSRSALVENHEALGVGTIDWIRLRDPARHGRAYGDGIIATAVLDLSGVVSRDNARAGILYQDSGGSITGSMATGNAIGLVTQTVNLLAGPEVADDNVFEGNAQNIMTTARLRSHDAATVTPELPDFN